MKRRGEHEASEERPAKKSRTIVRLDEPDAIDEGAFVAGVHPFNVAPRGNLLLACDDADADAVRVGGLGVMGLLDDSLLIDFLKTYCTPAMLGTLARCSRALRIFCSSDEIWKKLTLERFGDAFVPFEGSSWRATYANRALGTRGALFALAPSAEAEAGVRAAPSRTLFSDYLFQEWHMATVALGPWATRERGVRRIHASQLSVPEFRERFDWRNEPVVIEGAIDAWPARRGAWALDALIARFPERKFACGLADMTLGDYAEYMVAQREEVPLYLFDKAFGEKEPSLLDDYAVPAFFEEDFFSMLPAELRPAFRWWLLGPARSGSTFHKDPNYTSAWNALVWGCKKWILMPPDLVPPQVMPSDDGWDVTGPISLVNWYADVYAELDEEPYRGRVTEVIQRPGDLLFIPAQWWHSALNIEPSIAVTQNYVSRGNLPEVLNFLKRKGDDDEERVYEPLRAALEAQQPGVLDEIRAWRAAHRFNAKARFPMPRDHSGARPVSLWDRIEEKDKPPHGFVFDFGLGGGDADAAAPVQPQ